MKKHEISEGQTYQAKVNGQITTVRVDRIEEGTPYDRGYRAPMVYHVTNLRTGRKTTFRSAQKFIRPAHADPIADQIKNGGDRQPELNSTVTINKEPDPVLSGIASSPISGILRQSIAENEQRKAAKAGDNSPHVIVEARAGTGKTTTLVEGLKRVKGIPSTLQPSPQQAAVWDAMEQSRGKVNTICFVAFNKSIATELQNRVPAGCSAMTMHSLGFAAVKRAFGRVQVSSWRVTDIIAELMERDVRELRKFRPTLIKATEQLVGLCKMNLTGFNGTAEGFQFGPEEWEQALLDLAAHYDVDLNGDARDVIDLVPRVLDRCKDVKRDGRIDFDDMIWLPVVLNLPVERNDLLLVDEAQDLNRCQQALAKRAGDRLILCGDPKQAIYGFAGADSKSMPRMAEELGQTGRGCITLPLTVTRRCGKAIVEEAKRIVPDFDAFETNPEGKISNAAYPSENGDGQNYTTLVQDGDFLLCRVNAPLVSQCFRFLKAGRKANIQGRDVGQGLISTIKKLKASDVAELQAKLSDWHHAECEKENRKRNPNEQRLIGLQDRYDCLCCFLEDAVTIEAVIKRIEDIFTDDRNGRGIKLSSVHKAKGLEAHRVFILLPKGASMPHPMARSEWQIEQEMNLKYVAITRAIEELVWVTE